jgi:transcriptional regulator with XRE-family HTH domain
MTIGEKLQALRYNKHLSQEELVETLQKKYGVEIARDNYAKKENDSRPLLIEEIKAFCKFYKISADDLIFEERKIGNLKSMKHIRRVDLVAV